MVPIPPHRPHSVPSPTSFASRVGGGNQYDHRERCGGEGAGKAVSRSNCLFRQIQQQRRKPPGVPLRPGGTFDNSPAIHRWVSGDHHLMRVPEGRLTGVYPGPGRPPLPSAVPPGLVYVIATPDPAINRWASVGCPSGTRKRPSGLTVTVSCHYIPRSGKLSSCSGSDSHWANRSSTSFGGGCHGGQRASSAMAACAIWPASAEPGRRSSRSSSPCECRMRASSCAWRLAAESFSGARRTGCQAQWRSPTR